MIRAISFVFVAFMLISSSCEKQEELPFSKDSEGVLTSMPYQWKTSLSDNGTLIGGFLRPNVVYNDHMLFASQRIENELSMVSIATGEVLWQWNDFFDTQKKFFDIRYSHQYENHLIFQEGKQLYHLDLSNGTTLQKEEKEYRVARMAGIGTNYFIAGNFVLNKNGFYEGGVYVGDVIAQTSELLIKPKFTEKYPGASNEIGIVGSAVPFRVESNEILLTYDYSDRQSDGVNTYAGLYNYSKKEFLYDTKPLALGVNSYGSGVPIIYKDKVYYAPERAIVCLDLYSGKKLWEKEFPQGFTFSGFIVVDDKVIANNEDTYLYALDSQTGSQLWKEKSSGTSSPMAYLEGVVYFVGGGDGLLHAVEAETGKHLWRLQSPDLEINDGAWFKDEVKIVPPEEEGKKGKVLTSSYLSAFCYEAAR